MQDQEFHEKMIISYIEEYKHNKTQIIIKYVIYRIKNISYLYYGRIFPLIDSDIELRRKVLEFSECKYIQEVLSPEEFELFFNNLYTPEEITSDNQNYFIFKFPHNEEIFSSRKLKIEKRPYSPQWIKNLYDKHIYIKRGSTNRPIAPNELKN